MQTIYKGQYPILLKEIPVKAIPSKLYARGNLKLLSDPETKFLCIVGSRKNTAYGREVIEKLIPPLKDYNIVIISGLAYGIDTIAHKEALKHEIPTISIPGSGISPGHVYPKAHGKIAEEIVASGGLLLSEFEPDATPQSWFFPQRNRLMAGLAHAVLIIESAGRSGTLITAKLALDYNRTVMAVPGSIFSPHSEGVNGLIREGAEVVMSHEDILRGLGIEVTNDANLTEIDKQFLKYVDSKTPTHKIAEKLCISSTQASTICSYLRFKKIINEQYDVPFFINK